MPDKYLEDILALSSNEERLKLLLNDPRFRKPEAPPADPVGAAVERTPRAKRPRKPISTRCAVCATEVTATAFTYKRWRWCAEHTPTTFEQIQEPFEAEKREYARQRYHERAAARPEGVQGRRRLIEAGPPLTADEIAQVYARTQNKCAYCMRVTADQIDLYVHPKHGGQRTVDNARAACRPCARLKGDSAPAEWEKWQSRLYRVKGGA